MKSQRWYLRFPRGVPVAIFLLVTAITALSVYAIEQVEAQRAQAQHRQAAATATAALDHLISANNTYLKAGAAMLSMQPKVTRGMFAQFARQLESDTSLRVGNALRWVEFVDADKIPAFVRSMRSDGTPQFAVRPKPQGGTVAPIVYVEPDNPVTRGAVGFDVFSDPARRRAIERALSSGEPTGTGPVELVTDPTTGRSNWFVVYVPVYRGPPGDRRVVAGMLGRVFDTDAFVSTALSNEQMEGYGMAIRDAQSPTRAVLAARGPQADESRRVVRRFVIAGYAVDIELSPPPGTRLSNLSLLTLMFGMLVAALLLIVARLLTQQATEDRAALAWFEEQASIRNSLTRELNHRVKNTLANVLSIVSLTRRRTDSIDEFVTSLIGRVRALSATHDLLTRSEWGTTPIRDVISAELAPYAHDGDRVVSLRGPQVELAPSDALSLGMAIHELATNASKYGALSVPGGEVLVSWEMVTERLARIEWQERDGPPVPQARRRGFGTELIEKIVAHELKNPVDLRFDSHGVSCTLIVPVRVPATFQLRGGGQPRDGGQLRGGG